MYLAHRAELRGVEFFRLCAFVPSYDFSQASTLVHPIAIDQDFKAWYDIMTRLEHMFDLNIDLSDLEQRSDKLVLEWHAKIEQLAMKMPQLGVKNLIDQVNKEFTEMSFEPLSDVWEEALGDLFDDF
jgi:hypothetical protein